MPKAGARNGARRNGAASTNPNRSVDAKAKASSSSLRSKATINRLNMYRSKVKRNKSGKIVKGGLAVGETVREMKAARVQPDRRWFGNTRVVGQKELTEFREQMEATAADPYAVVLKRNKLPMSLVTTHGMKKGRVDILRAESFKVGMCQSTATSCAFGAQASLHVCSGHIWKAPAEEAAEAGHFRAIRTLVDGRGQSGCVFRGGRHEH